MQSLQVPNKKAHASIFLIALNLMKSEKANVTFPS